MLSPLRSPNSNWHSLASIVSNTIFTRITTSCIFTPESPFKSPETYPGQELPPCTWSIAGMPLYPVTVRVNSDKDEISFSRTITAYPLVPAYDDPR